ncbi:hypothetical protein HWV62_21328 [Athelia sp. TMB]|nr:hypothetical protein HWV62_21328 [Athelia sp. TMB]
MPLIMTTEQVAALSGIERSKRLAAFTAVDQNLLPRHRVVGIGSGSTVPYVVERIFQRGEENKDRVFIPSGFQSKELIVSAGMNLGDVDQYPTIDVTFDGADEVDHDLNCIKGGGACHLREKVLAEAAKIFILVADYRKNVEFLGTNVRCLFFSCPRRPANTAFVREQFKQGVPIEVVPFAYAKVLQNLHTIIGSPHASLRMAVKKAGPVVTDNANFIIDAPFTREYMKDPYLIMAKMKMITGVVEVGLFCHMAKAAYFGNDVSIDILLVVHGTCADAAPTQDGTVTIKREGRVTETIKQDDA